MAWLGDLLAWVLVLGAAVYAGRRIWRQVSAARAAPGCSSCDACPGCTTRARPQDSR